jgi:hypothetical protein
VTISMGFAAIPASQRQAAIDQLCDAMDAADKEGCYPQLTVERPWSVHNPVLEGEFASPSAIRWYLERELSQLAAAGARISVSQGRKAMDLHDPRLAGTCAARNCSCSARNGWRCPSTACSTTRARWQMTSSATCC